MTAQPRTLQQPHADSARIRFAVISTDGPTHAPRFNPDFVDQVAIELRDALTCFAGGEVELNAYSAPWDAADRPQGQLTLRLRSGARCAELGIVFGAPDELPDVPYRRLFDRESFESAPTNPHACGIYLANFDECWVLCCRILQDVRPATVNMSFGA